MARTARLAFLSLSLLLVLFPLGIVRPGWPPTLKADEPAYYGMALSLAHDLDVHCDFEDVRRLVNSHPFLPINNLILMSDDGWQTVYYGKPYVFSLVAAPAVRLFGEHGMVAVNMLMLVAMIWMGATYLSRFNRQSVALLFAAGFFILSTAFVYVFWLQPEIFNMFSIAACLFLAFHEPEATPRTAGSRYRLLRVLASGAVLALAVYNKPAFAAMGLPALWVVYRRRGLKAAGAWLAAAALALGLLAGLGYALSGHPSAYLGVARGGVRLEDPASPEDYLREMRAFVERRGDETVNAWTWIFRIPEIDVDGLRENLGYFLWGRHTGLILYTPLAVLAFGLFLLATPRSGSRWLVVLSMAIVGLFFIIFIPFNWHGGGGFVGNRYFIAVYPGFLFLVTRIRPLWSVPAGFAVGALSLGPLVFTPFGAPVPSPTLQAHTRNFPFRHFPLELSIKRNVPGYSGTNLGGVRLLGRTDRVRTSARQPGRVWIQGGTKSEIYLLTGVPLEGVVLEVESLAPDNDIRLELGGDERTSPFEAGRYGREGTAVVTLEPEGYDRVSFDDGKPVFVYTLEVATSNGRAELGKNGKPLLPFVYGGVAIAYLGRHEQLEGEAHHRVAWVSVTADPRVAAGGTLPLVAEVRNTGESAWSSEGPLPVYLAYRWLDADGRKLEREGVRSAFAKEVEPDKKAKVAMEIRAPEAPGRYTLVLDLVRERVTWFSRRGADVHELAVEVTPAQTAAES